MPTMATMPTAPRSTKLRPVDGSPLMSLLLLLLLGTMATVATAVQDGALTFSAQHAAAAAAAADGATATKAPSMSGAEEAPLPFSDAASAASSTAAPQTATLQSPLSVTAAAVATVAAESGASVAAIALRGAAMAAGDGAPVGPIGSGTADSSSSRSGDHGNITLDVSPSSRHAPQSPPAVTHEAIMQLGQPEPVTTANPAAPIHPPVATHAHRTRHSPATTTTTTGTTSALVAIKPKPRKRLATANSMPGDAAAHPPLADGEPPMPLGVCQEYSGTTCDQYLRNQSVFVPPHLTIGLLESRLKAAYGVIRESKDMNPNCRGYALPSLCYSILPICRTPEKTNHQYFANKANHEHLAKKSAAAAAAAKQKKSSSSLAAAGRRSKTTTTTTRATTTTEAPLDTTPAQQQPPFEEPTDEFHADLVGFHGRPHRRRRSFDVRIDSRTKSVHNTHYLHANSDDFGLGLGIGQKPFPPTRSTENLRRICRNECELLENELCQKEYAIAKRHPTIGQMLPLEDCFNLPDSTDCSKMGIAIDSDENELCYWENGSGYRGTVAVSASGKPCLQWARLMMTIANYPELAGRNYCRNPGGSEAGPWCFVDNNLGSLEKSIELCAIPRCSDQMWLYIIVGFISVASIIVTAVSVCCCKKYRKQASMSNIQNINLPNVDKNIYGNSRLNSPIEMTSLLHGAANSIQGMQQPTGRNNSALRVAQYTLGDVRFVEELGEGAFGKVYKGELSQPSGEKIFVAVKALKENASAKTQADFKREIELISDLRHDNIVCILGVVLKEEPLCMLFEYMTQGDLHEFLIANSPNEGKLLTQLQFLLISMQICDGMEYLSGHHYVHRDLAARNCLVGGSLIVKISDFGLSRDIYSSDYYRVQSKSLLPVRWMPSESILYGKFTTESDVWSYGVVLWEIYSYGLQPYYGYSNQEVISMVRARQLLPCPEVCPSAVYTLMVECWHEQAVRRPSFPEIGHRLKIWYQAQKRNELNENTSLCPSRKGSTFSVLSTANRPLPPTTTNTSTTPATNTSITPSTSSHQLNGTSSTLGRDRDNHHQHHPQPPTASSQHTNSSGCLAKEPAPSAGVKERYGANHHSLDREKLRAAHQQQHQQLVPAGSAASINHPQPHHHQHHHHQHHSNQAANNHQHHHHHQHQQQHHHPHQLAQHRSLDRDNSNASSKSNASMVGGKTAVDASSISGRLGGQLPKSRSSNNSLSQIANGQPQSQPQHYQNEADMMAPASGSPSHLQQQQQPHQQQQQQHRRSQFDATEPTDAASLPPLPGGLASAGQSRSNSRGSMHRPPKDPKAPGSGSHHHHHHHHHHHGQHHGDGQQQQQRKKSIGPTETDVANGGGSGGHHRKLSAANSMSSMHSEASAVSSVSAVSAYSQQSRHNHHPHHQQQQQQPMAGDNGVGAAASAARTS